MANRDDAAVMLSHDLSDSTEQQPAAADGSAPLNEEARDSQVQAIANAELYEQVELSARRERPTLMGLAQITETLGVDAGHADAAQDDAPEPAAQPSESAAVAEVSVEASAPAAPSTPVHASLPQEHQEGDGEWLDLSTRWLMAACKQPAQDAEAPRAEHWADSLSAQIAPAPADARGSSPPPPPKARTTTQRSLRETWNDAVPHARSSERHSATAPRHSTLSGLQPLDIPALDDIPAYPPIPGAPPPWAAGYPAYAAPPWAATLQPYAAAPWAAPHMPTGAFAAARHDSGVVHWTSVGNAWLTAAAKFAFAAMALHYSGVAEPLLAHFGYAHAAAAPAPVATLSDAMARPPMAPALPVALPSPLPAATVQPPAPEPAPAASTRRAPTAKRSASASTTASTRHRAAEPAPELREKPASAAAARAKPPDHDSAGEATLRINSRPWSQVFVDGTLVGHTPKLDLRVSAGMHRIRLVNPDLQISKVVELQAAAGETISRVELLSQ